MTQITEEMVKKVYTIAKDVCNDKLTKVEAIVIMNTNYGMSEASASCYISTYQQMISGELFKLTINEFATKYFLAHILVDSGLNALSRALESVRRHLDYQETHKYNKLPTIKRIYKSTF